MSKYGILLFGQMNDGEGSRVEAWGLQVRPHVAIKLKRLFPRILETRADLITLADTPEVAADLAWFTVRYPLDMTPAVAEHLRTQAERHRVYTEQVDDLLAGHHTLDSFPPAARPARPYQQQGADLAYLTGGLLLGDEVGLGKTQTAIMLLRDPTTLPALGRVGMQ